MQKHEKWYSTVYSNADSLKYSGTSGERGLFTSSRRVIPLLRRQHVYREMYALYSWRIFRSMQKELRGILASCPFSRLRTRLFFKYACERRVTMEIRDMNHLSHHPEILSANQSKNILCRSVFSRWLVFSRKKRDKILKMETTRHANSIVRSSATTK